MIDAKINELEEVNSVQDLKMRLSTHLFSTPKEIRVHIMLEYLDKENKCQTGHFPFSMRVNPILVKVCNIALKMGYSHSTSAKHCIQDPLHARVKGLKMVH